MPPPNSTTLIVNARARRGSAWFEGAAAMLHERGVPVGMKVLLSKGQSLQETIAKAIEEGSEAILVGGGDGTLSQAAKQVARSRSVLGVLPLGTGNAFARDLGIRSDLVHATDVIADGFVGEVDYGMADGRAFLNVASLGLSTIIASRLAKGPKKLLGPLAYVAPLLQALRIVRPFRAKLVFPDGEESLSAYQIVIGNGRFHAGPFPLDESAKIDSGEFLIYAVTSVGRSVLYKYMAAVLFGRTTDLPEVRVWRRTQLRIESSSHHRIVLDGEPAARTPCTFTVVPKGLRVLMPRPE